MFRTIVKHWEIKETPLVTTLPYDYTFDICCAKYREDNTLVYKVEKRTLFAIEPVTNPRILFQPEETVDRYEYTYQELPLYAKHFVNTKKVYISNDPYEDNSDNSIEEAVDRGNSNCDWDAACGRNTNRLNENWDDQYPSTSGSYEVTGRRTPIGPPISSNSSQAEGFNRSRSPNYTFGNT